MRFALPALFVIAVLALSHPAAAQPPKAPLAPKLNAQKIQAAETALTDFGCQFDRIQDQKDPLFGQIRVVKFPAKTTDGNLNRLITQLQSSAGSSRPSILDQPKSPTSRPRTFPKSRG